MFNESIKQSGLRKYDLEERTAKFGEEVIKLCKKLPKTDITKHLISQIIRSSTSIGANYMEANGASSKKDFRNKIHIVKKECGETKHFLRMIAVAVPDKKNEVIPIWQECHELVLIFQKIAQSMKSVK
ncbi:MAG: four helix bundle protein [Candidatus Peribacteraceae bacterium]|jgi:four helix bundle protein|nr:four helix bundle protein [Candidatus Peribacteraceae bacterium]HCI04059.1 four helix bundle protein [Candidatus Peribacteria bacterium]|tara:strand:+ start:1432 stop:1815 length:384 start_codon:yes stop_codon:yes gene_type:complete